MSVEVLGMDGKRALYNPFTLLLFKACRSGDSETVKESFKRGVSISVFILYHVLSCFDFSG